LKLLNVEIIEETPLPRHECAGHCTGKNGGDGMCYHDDGTRHPVGACRQAEAAVDQDSNRPD
jgi:hypothetical protein